jgi:hypothetical protein
MTPSSWLFALAFTLPALALAASLWPRRKRTGPTSSRAHLMRTLRED